MTDMVQIINETGKETATVILTHTPEALPSWYPYAFVGSIIFLILSILFVIKKAQAEQKKHEDFWNYLDLEVADWIESI